MVNRIINDGFVQLHGPFKAKEELITKIMEKLPTLENGNPDFVGIKKIGINSIPEHKVSIKNNVIENSDADSNIFEIGKTGILEFSEINVNSIQFQQNEPESTLIDCVLEGSGDL